MRWFLCDGFSYELLVFGGFLIQIVSFKVIFIIKKGYVYAWGGRVKMCEFCVYAFLKSKSMQAKNVQKVRQNSLFTTTQVQASNVNFASFLGSQNF